MKTTILTFVILLLSFNCLLAQFSGGSGTSGDPWQISNTTDLTTLSTNSIYWGDYFIQTANINAPAGSFSPIGDVDINFTGTYDGDEHTIDGLYISGSTDYCGFFGYADGANIINLGLINVNISTNLYTGALVGQNTSGTVSNCFSTGIVSGTGRVVGGLVGLNLNGGEIIKCYSSCTVTSGIRASGGLVGRNSNSTVSNCYSTGDVNGGIRVGGLIGFNRGSSIVSNCFSAGFVNGSDPTGGLVGENIATVSDSCFWDTETSGQSTSDGGMGLPTDSMKTLETFTEAGWDFIGISIDSIWNIGNGRNDGYPYFQWQYPADPPLPVELSSFTASVSINDVTLKWTTAWEINNAGFEVERQSLSSGKDIWTKIGFVQGNGTTNEPKNYTFDDKKLYTGKYNYRLKQIDYNNNSTLYDLNNEVEIGIPKKFELSQNYPNPFNPITKIDYNIPFNGNVSLKIYDISGREITTLVNNTQEAGFYTVQFNANNFASGTYFYRISANNGQENFVMTKRMLLIK